MITSAALLRVGSCQLSISKKRHGLVERKIDHPALHHVLANYRGLLEALGNTPDQIEQKRRDLTCPPNTGGS